MLWIVSAETSSSARAPDGSRLVARLGEALMHVRDDDVEHGQHRRPRQEARDDLGQYEVERRNEQAERRRGEHDTAREAEEDALFATRSLGWPNT